MKNFFKGFGLCLVAFLVFVVMQAVVANIIQMPMGYQAAKELGIEAKEKGIEMTRQEIMEEGNKRVAERYAPFALPAAEIGGLCAVGIFALVALIRKKKVSEALGFKKVPGSAFGVAAILAVLYNSIAMGFIAIVNMFSTSYQEASSAVLSGNMIVTAICAVICAPIIEEIIFRAVAFRGSKTMLPKIVAAIIASGFFALAHGSSIAWIAYTFVMGLIACYLVEKYDSILPSILFHVGFNLLGSLVLPYCPGIVVIAYIILGTVASAVLGVVMIVKAAKNKANGSKRPEIVTAA
ncbi:MAG: CPBP family intramembrane metalloprotease [Lachnospiraceae bacterium]|nr:CPBP family intramembrane metalloprotease [Lachnospiraceae bacterium]